MSEINKQYTTFQKLAATIGFPIEDGEVSTNLIKCVQTSTITFNEEYLKMLKTNIENRITEIDAQLAIIDGL